MNEMYSLSLLYTLYIWFKSIALVVKIMQKTNDDEPEMGTSSNPILDRLKIRQIK